MGETMNKAERSCTLPASNVGEFERCDSGAESPGAWNERAHPARRRAPARVRPALPVPDLAQDKGGALVVDTSALELGADEIAEPLTEWVEATRR